MKESTKKHRPKSGCRFYYPDKLASGSDVHLPHETAHHAIRTLRLQAGDPIILFDGSGGEYLAHIHRIDRNEVIARTGEFIEADAESPVQVTLAQAISSGERMDFTIQKAVELGISATQPLETERCVVRLNKERAIRRTTHWRKVAISACEQSGRNRVVEVAEPKRLNDWLDALDREAAVGELRLLLAPDADMTLADLPEQTNRILLLAGPEGGLAPAEMDMAARRGFRVIRLGPRILRTETAALAALAAIQLRWGDF